MGVSAGWEPFFLIFIRADGLFLHVLLPGIYVCFGTAVHLPQKNNKNVFKSVFENSNF